MGMTAKLPLLRAGAAVVACLAFGALPAGSALAGPCSDQISEISRTLGGSAAGGPTGKEHGTLAGAAPGAIQHDAPMPTQGAPGGSADGSAGGEGGKEMGTYAGNAPGSMAKPVDPAAGKATSSQDVRLQQQGMPTVAQGGDPTAVAGGGSTSPAMAALEEARALDQQGSQDCMTKVDEAKRLMGG